MIIDDDLRDRLTVLRIYGNAIVRHTNTYWLGTNEAWMRLKQFHQKLVLDPMSHSNVDIAQLLAIFGP